MRRHQPVKKRNPSALQSYEFKRSKAYSSLVGPWAVAPKPQNLQKLHGAGPVLQRNHNAENPCKLHSMGRKHMTAKADPLTKPTLSLVKDLWKWKDNALLHRLQTRKRPCRTAPDILAIVRTHWATFQPQVHPRLRWKKFLGCVNMLKRCCQCKTIVKLQILNIHTIGVGILANVILKQGAWKTGGPPVSLLLSLRVLSTQNVQVIVSSFSGSKTAAIKSQILSLANLHIISTWPRCFGDYRARNGEVLLSQGQCSTCWKLLLKGLQLNQTEQLIGKVDDHLHTFEHLDTSVKAIPVQLQYSIMCMCTYIYINTHVWHVYTRIQYVDSETCASYAYVDSVEGLHMSTL